MTIQVDGVAERLAALEAHIARLDSENAQLRRELAAVPAAPAEPSAPTASRGGTQTRRNLLKGGAIAAGAAAVAPLLSTTQAAAATGDAVVVGEYRESSNGFGTSLGVRGPAGTKPFGAGFHVSDFTVGFAESPAALHGLATGFHLWNGVIGAANARRAGETSPSSGHGVIAGVGSQGRSNLFVVPNGQSPTLDNYSHAAGEIRSAEPSAGDAELWVCTTSGTPGKWRKLAGPSTSGTAHIINSSRVYDSRFVDGPLIAGQSRTILVSHEIDVTTGAITTLDLVPVGARAVAFNLTIFATTAAGVLSVQDGAATTFTSSTINWFGAAQVLANGSLSAIDARRGLKIFASGAPGASAGFVIDITGYWL